MMRFNAIGRRATLRGLAGAVAAPALVRAQGTYPSRPVRYINPYPAGGPTDTLSRLFCARMSELTGQQWIVENRGGAGGNVGMDALAKSDPDGYSLGLGGIAVHAIAPTLYAKLPFNPRTDFTFVSTIWWLPNLLAVNLDVPAKSVPELIELCRNNPGKYSYGSAGAGTTLHLSGELFKLGSERPAALALGYEHRNEYGNFINQPILAAGWDSDTGSPGPVDTRGGFYVNEAYGELVIPVISHVPHSLEFFNIVFFAVVISTIVQGTTFEPLAHAESWVENQPSLRPFHTPIRELLAALRRDPVVARHYSEVDLDSLREVHLDRDAFAYVSFRMDEKIYWTSRKVKLQAGETEHPKGRRAPMPAGHEETHFATALR